MRTQRNPHGTRQVIHIVGEGLTELFYFSHIKRLMGYRCSISPRLFENNSIEKIEKKIKDPIEHKVFCYITRACQGVIFKNIEIVNELIGRSKTKTGLKVYSRILDTIYETGKKIRDDFKEKMTIKFDDYLGK